MKLRRVDPLGDAKTSSAISDMMYKIKLRPRGNSNSLLVKQEPSEMPLGISSLVPERHSKKENISKVTRWSDFPDEKAKTSRSIRQLNIIPSGMIFKSDKRLVTSNVLAGASKKNTTPTELKKMETSKRSCIVECKCGQCRECNSDMLFETKAKFASMVNPKNIKPPLLFKTETEINNDVIKFYTSEHAIRPKVLVHGSNIPSPVKSIMDVPFHSNIHQVLRSFQHPTSIQSFVWPALMRHMNVCMVSPPKSGTTMAYLPAICSYLLEKDKRYMDLPQNYVAPIAVILCAEIETAEQVFSCVCNIIQNSRNKSVPALAIPPMDKRCLNQFYKQCDILVTTPMTLVDLVHARIISFNRICHFVIENADTILEKFPQEMDILFRLIQSKLSYRSCYNTVLLVVSAEQWTTPLENLMKRLNSTPMICIQSDFEAAMYGRVQLNVDFQKAEDKIPKLANILQNEANIRKTLVIFNTDEEIEIVKEYLIISGVQSIIIYDAMEEEEILDCEMRWLNSVDGKHLALLCTDKIYNRSLHISNAVHLIYFSLPKTLDQFVSRFGCMWDNYKSPLTAEEPDSIQTRCSVNIFVDESCKRQFRKLMEILVRMGVEVTPNYLNIYKGYRRTIEKKENILFCEDLSATNVTVTKLNVRKTLQDQNLISNCENQLEELYNLCKNARIEKPYFDLPVRGKQIQPQWAYFENTVCSKVCITTLYSPSLFYVRLIKYYDLFENLLKDIQEVIAKPFYPSKFEVQVDKYYLAKHPESDNFCRVKILEIIEDVVEVFYVDYGNNATVNIANLKYLSNELIEKLPFQAIECRLYGIKPALEDWQPKAIDIVYRYSIEPNTNIYRTLYTGMRKQEPALTTGGQKCAILLLVTFKGKPIFLNQLLISCGEAMIVKNEE